MVFDEIAKNGIGYDTMSRMNNAYHREQFAKDQTAWLVKCAAIAFFNLRSAPHGIQHIFATFLDYIQRP